MECSPYFSDTWICILIQLSRDYSSLRYALEYHLSLSGLSLDPVPISLFCLEGRGDNCQEERELTTGNTSIEVLFNTWASWDSSGQLWGVSFSEIDLYLWMSKEREWERAEEVSANILEENPSLWSKFINNICLMFSTEIKRTLSVLK